MGPSFFGVLQLGPHGSVQSVHFGQHPPLQCATLSAIDPRFQLVADMDCMYRYNKANKPKVNLRVQHFSLMPRVPVALTAFQLAITLNSNVCLLFAGGESKPPAQFVDDGDDVLPCEDADAEGGPDPIIKRLYRCAAYAFEFANAGLRFFLNMIITTLGTLKPTVAELLAFPKPQLRDWYVALLNCQRCVATNVVVVSHLGLAMQILEPTLGVSVDFDQKESDLTESRSDAGITAGLGAMALNPSVTFNRVEYKEGDHVVSTGRHATYLHITSPELWAHCTKADGSPADPVDIFRFVKDSLPSKGRTNVTAKILEVLNAATGTTLPGLPNSKIDFTPLTDLIPVKQETRKKSRVTSIQDEAVVTGDRVAH